MSNLTESGIENAAVAWFECLGYAVKYGAEIAPGQPCSERTDYDQVFLGVHSKGAEDTCGEMQREAWMVKWKTVFTQQAREMPG